MELSVRVRGYWIAQRHASAASPFAEKAQNVVRYVGLGDRHNREMGHFTLK